ncbi:PepSY domain-containing protein [[Pseudomonas] boreopolis]|uniref:PepSY domain-containing protein n=1 Tax=Xanthomonas boreopolis TaxID=86183 RepID=UPI003DA1B0AD
MEHIVIAFVLATSAASGAHSSELLGPTEVAAALDSAGYGQVRDIEFDSGLWEAEVRRSYGRWAEVSVHPKTGEIYDLHGKAEVLPMRDVLAALERQGYRGFRDIDRDAGVWDIDAEDRNGRRVELRVSGYDGRVLHSAPDLD